MNVLTSSINKPVILLMSIIILSCSADVVFAVRGQLER